jgi:metal-responsive CopG/Arc/MetJ family transcriptional regulator
MATPSKITTLRVPNDLLKELGRIARRENRSRSNLILNVLASYAQRVRKQEKRADVVDVLD